MDKVNKEVVIAFRLPKKDVDRLNEFRIADDKPAFTSIHKYVRDIVMRSIVERAKIE